MTTTPLRPDPAVPTAPPVDAPVDLSLSRRDLAGPPLRSAGGTRSVLTARPGPRLRSFRPDVEGLRAVAVLAVVGYHAGVPGFSGGFVGVDVFLVISGFLITRMLVRELGATGRIDLPAFYARRARRLLPAALLVSAATTLAGWVLLSPLAARDLVRDAAFATVYGMNWHLAQDGTDYLRADRTPSALQHYWSLSVEEQFYLLWPALLAGLWLLTRTLRRRRTPGDTVDGTGRADRAGLRATALALAVLGCASFAACVVQTSTSAPWAYFGLHTRAWELALGAGLALLAPALSWRAGAVATALTWGGLAAVGGAVVAFDAGTPFPGVAALLPTLGTAAVIAGGCAAPRTGAELLLGRRPLQVVGALSYGWYLWHWPLLVLAPQVVGRPLSTRASVLACLVALLVAAGTFAVVEHPIRVASRLRGLTRAVLATAVTGTALVAASCLAVLTLAPAVTGSGDDARLTALDDAGPSARAPQDGGAEATGDTRGPEAAVVVALEDGLRQRPVPRNLVPRLDRALTTLPLPQTQGCHAGFSEAAVAPSVGRTACVYGAAGGPTVVLFGDSHALQWFPALEELAGRHGWRLVSLTKSSCPAFDVTVWNETLRRAYTECDTWRRDAVRLIGDLRPDRVVVSSMTAVLDHGLHGGGRAFDEAWAAGVSSTVRRLAALGADVTVLDDTPLPGREVPTCVADVLDDASACALERAGAVHPRARREAQRAASASAGARVVDPVPWLCLERCPVVVGNVLAYRDAHHISPQLARWLAPVLDAALTRPARSG